MDNDNEVKVILPRDFFLTKTVREINCKPIVPWLANLIFFLLIQCCLKIQQQLGQKTNLPCAEVIAMFTTVAYTNLVSRTNKNKCAQCM